MTVDIITVHLAPGQRSARAALAAEPGSNLDRVRVDAVDHQLFVPWARLCGLMLKGDGSFAQASQMA